jgi:DnaK suppressor protein
MDTGSLDAAAVLAARREQLEQQLDRLATPAEDLGNISFGKRIGEGTSQAVDRIADVSAHDKLRAMLTEVRRAEAKLAEGSYGRCDVCGGDIGAERLEARPWATRCVTDANRP